MGHRICSGHGTRSHRICRWVSQRSSSLYELVIDLAAGQGSVPSIRSWIVFLSQLVTCGSGPREETGGRGSVHREVSIFHTESFRYHEKVRDEWIDYNGHLSEPFYVMVFGFATTNLMDEVSLDEHYRVETDASLYTVEAHIHYLRESGRRQTSWSRLPFRPSGCRNCGFAMKCTSTANWPPPRDCSRYT